MTAAQRIYCTLVAIISWPLMTLWMAIALFVAMLGAIDTAWTFDKGK